MKTFVDKIVVVLCCLFIGFILYIMIGSILYNYAHDNCWGRESFKGRLSNPHWGFPTEERCFSCDELEKWIEALPNQCSKCSNREMVEKYCQLQCPSNTYKDLSGNCKMCNDNKVSSAKKEQCDKCSNRMYENEKCVLKHCPENTFRTTSMDCASCDDEHSLNSKKEECLKCSNREMIEIGTKNEYPVLPDSLPEKIEKCVLKCEGKCRDYWGNCYKCDDCDYVGAYFATENECLRCPNRKIVENLCILKTCPDGMELSLPTGCVKKFYGVY